MSNTVHVGKYIVISFLGASFTVSRVLWYYRPHYESTMSGLRIVDSVSDALDKLKIYFSVLDVGKNA